jgi:hypothetical protein
VLQHFETDVAPIGIPRDSDLRLDALIYEVTMVVPGMTMGVTIDVVVSCCFFRKMMQLTVVTIDLHPFWGRAGRSVGAEGKRMATV